MRVVRCIHLVAITLLIAWPGRPTFAQEESTRRILDKVPTYQKVVSEIRGARFEKDVPASIQSKEDFRAFVEREMEEEIPPEKVKGWEGSFRKLGLLDGEYDLAGGLKQFIETQAGAYYDSKTKAFYVVQADVPPEAARVMVVHELHHALQDQMFDLEKMLDEARESKDGDRESALTFLVEGEATYVMMLDVLKQQGMDIEQLPPQVIEMSLGMSRKLSVKQMTKMQGMAPPGMGIEGGDIEEAMKALEQLPVIIVRSFTDPYIWGAYAIAKVHAREGWEGVSDLFRHPPASTELLLHPEKLMDGGDPPVHVEAVDLLDLLGEGWERVHDDTFGEHGILCLLDEHLAKPDEEEAETAMDALLNAGPTPGEEAAAGWGGDRYTLFQHPKGGSVLAWVTTWDREEDAKEFFEAYRAAMQAGFAPTTSIDAGADRFREVVGSDLRTENIYGLIRGKDVILLHAPTSVNGERVLDRIAAARGEAH